MTPAREDADERWRWWEGRRLPFTLACAASYVTVAALSEFAGVGRWDRIGLSAPALLAYAVGCVVFLLCVNGFFQVGTILERLIDPADPGPFRKRAFAVVLAISLLALPALLVFSVVVTR